MIEFKLKEGEEFIKLGQLLKACSMVTSGTEAKFLINDGLIKLNGNKELRRGKKIYKGDIVEGQDMIIKVIK